MLLNVHARGNVGVFIKGSSMAEIGGLVRALREGDDAAKAEAARRLGTIAWSTLNQAAIAEAGGIPPLVELLRDGNAEGKLQAAWALAKLALDNAANRVLIAEAGGIAPLVELLRDDRERAKVSAAWVLYHVACNNNANQGAIAAAGGILPLVQLLRDGSADVKAAAAQALRNLARNNASNAVAIAAAVGLETLVQLARRGRMTFKRGIARVPCRRPRQAQGRAGRRRAARRLRPGLGPARPQGRHRVLSLGRDANLRPGAAGAAPRVPVAGAVLLQQEVNMGINLVQAIMMAARF